MKTEMRLLFIAGTVLVLIAACALPARATFPGKNGRIAFIQGPDVYTMNPDGSDVQQITFLSDDNPAFWESWSPDGKQLVFSIFPAPDFNGEIWMMNANGSNQHLVYSDPGFDLETPSFSPDGKQIVFNHCQLFPTGDLFCGIQRVQADGSGITTLTPIQVGIGDWEPVYSPNGTTIAFDSFDRGGVIGGVHLMNADGSNIRLLTPPAVGGENPDWSPNGEKVAFSTHCCNPQNAEIWSINPDRSDVGSLTNTDDLNDFEPSWSPQGNGIVFQRFGPHFGSLAIFTMKADGSDVTQRLLLPNNTRSPLARLRSAGTHRGSPGSNHHARRIEDGGSNPRWGAAAE